MGTAEALTELRVNGVFTTSAPVLQVEDKFLKTDDLFDGSEVNKDSLSKFLSINF